MGCRKGVRCGLWEESIGTWKEKKEMYLSDILDIEVNSLNKIVAWFELRMIG